MLNPFIEINWKPDVAERRKFALSLVIGFPCIAGILALVNRLANGFWSFGLPLYLGLVGAGIGLLLRALPALALPFYIAWYALACCIGFIVGNVLLALVYFAVVTVIGIIIRLFGHAAVRRTFNRNASTYWRDAAQPEDPQFYFRQF